jgi:diguanylate cyclase (GGDEF)-like protein/PAS domain S-box-containing protein
LDRLYSFKIIIGIALLWLALLAYGLAFYSTEVYRELAIADKNESLQVMLETKSREIVDSLYEQQNRFALEIQKNVSFIQALTDPNRDRLRAWMTGNFDNLASDTDEFRLKSVIVRDLDGGILAEAGDNSPQSYSGCIVTLNAINEASFKSQISKNALCSHENNLYTEVLTPVDIPDSRVYLQIIAHAIDGLKALEQHMGMPLQIIAGNRKVRYRSSNWPDTESDIQLRPVFNLYGDDLILGANITGSLDLHLFLGHIEHTRDKFLIVTTIATGVVLIAILILLGYAFMPLNNLRNSVGALLTGTHVPISEKELPYELRDLVSSYNEMVEGLETETINRRQMEEKLRSEKDFITTTLNSINNPVIVINSKGLIKLVNPGGEKLFGDKEVNLMNQSIHESLILYSNRHATHIVDVKHLLTRKTILNSMFFYDPGRNIVELEFSASPMIDMEAEDVGYVIILKDVSEDRKLRRKLNYEGSHDRLTRFLNRSAFEQRFENLVTEDSDTNPQHVLAYLDVDQFKIVNETGGNTAGDVLLRQVGSIIKMHVRKSDILSRLGGDQFGLIMPFFEIEKAMEVMQKILIGIQQTGFEWEDKQYQVTASIGTMAFGQVNDEYHDFYSKVIAACSIAKKNGGNQYHSIDENDEKVRAQQVSMDWVAGIMKGLKEDLFCLYVQPIISMDNSDSSAHYEVLIRYRSPDGSIVSPNEFLPSAERYNLIEKIDTWVVKMVIQWLEDHPDRDIMFSVNLSGRSIGSPTFHKFLQECLQQSSVKKSALCFEITETSMVENVEKSVEFINSIKRIGAKFSLDDFGTGLSSFSYLKRFPVDFLKIDGVFVRDIIENDTSFVFVRSMAEVGHSLDMKIIAEFVESGTMFGRLREAKIDYIQGYHVGRPTPIESLEIDTEKTKKSITKPKSKPKAKAKANTKVKAKSITKKKAS